MIVRRIETDGGSHIEPPLDQSWTELAKLEWHAAVTSLDVGFTVAVVAPDPKKRSYCVMVPGASVGSAGFDHTWTLLNGISTGGRAARVVARIT